MDTDAMYLLLAAGSALLAFIPAALARRRGRSFAVWWIYGVVLIVVALPHALMLSPEGKRMDSSEPMPCPGCGEPLPGHAVGCRHCGWQRAESVRPLDAGRAAGLSRDEAGNRRGDEAADSSAPEDGASRAARDADTDALPWSDEAFARISRMGPGPEEPRVSKPRLVAGMLAAVALAVGVTALLGALSWSSWFGAAPPPEARIVDARPPAQPEPPVPSLPQPDPPPVAPPPASSGPTMPTVPSPETPAEPAVPPPPPPPDGAWMDDRGPAGGDRAASVVSRTISDPPAEPAPVEPALAEPAPAGPKPGEPARIAPPPAPEPPPSRPADVRPGDRPADAAARVGPSGQPLRGGGDDVDDVSAVGELVVWLQRRLLALGYFDGPVDGRADARTRAAIRRWQAARQMTPTGRIDPALIVSLRRASVETDAARADAP